MKKFIFAAVLALVSISGFAATWKAEKVEMASGDVIAYSVFSDNSVSVPFKGKCRAQLVFRGDDYPFVMLCNSVFSPEGSRVYGDGEFLSGGMISSDYRAMFFSGLNWDNVMGVKQLRISVDDYHNGTNIFKFNMPKNLPNAIAKMIVEKRAQEAMEAAIAQKKKVNDQLDELSKIVTQEVVKDGNGGVVLYWDDDHGAKLNYEAAMAEIKKQGKTEIDGEINYQLDLAMKSSGGLKLVDRGDGFSFYIYKYYDESARRYIVATLLGKVENGKLDFYGIKSGKKFSD